MAGEASDTRLGSATSTLTAPTNPQLRLGIIRRQIRTSKSTSGLLAPCWDLDGAATWHLDDHQWDDGPLVRLILDRQDHVWVELWSWLRPETRFGTTTATVAFGHENWETP